MCDIACVDLWQHYVHCIRLGVTKEDWCNPIHLFCAQHGSYVPVLVSRDVLGEHRCIYVPPCSRTSQHSKTLMRYVSISLDRSLWPHIRWGGTD